MERPPIRGIIFDKDGTLFNYAEVWGEVVGKGVDEILMTFSFKNPDAARLRLFEIIGIDDIGNAYPGGFLFNHDKKVRALMGSLWFCIRNRINPLSLIKVSRRIVGGVNQPLVIEKLKSMDFSGLRDLMDRLSAKGVVLGVVTHDTTSNSKAFLEAMGIDGKIQFLRTKESNCKAKPSPEAAKQFSALFGIPMEQVAVVGDSPVDMAFAQNAKAGYTIAVMTGFGVRGVLEKTADVVYDSVEDLVSDPVLFPEGL